MSQSPLRAREDQRLTSHAVSTRSSCSQIRTKVDTGSKKENTYLKDEEIHPFFISSDELFDSHRARAKYRR